MPKSKYFSKEFSKVPSSGISFSSERWMYSLSLFASSRGGSPLLLLLLIWMSSCSSIQPPEFRNVDNIQLKKMGKKESTLLASVRYYNPNNTRLQLREASGDTWMDDQWLGKFSVDSLVQIPAKGDFILPVTLRTDLGTLLQNSLTALMGRQISIRFKGKARVGKGFIFVNYPIEYEGKKRLDELIK